MLHMKGRGATLNCINRMMSAFNAKYCIVFIRTLNFCIQTVGQPFHNDGDEFEAKFKQRTYGVYLFAN